MFNEFKRKQSSPVTILEQANQPKVPISPEMTELLHKARLAERGIKLKQEKYISPASYNQLK